MFLFFKFFQKSSDFFRINIIEIFIRHYRNILEFWRIFQKCLNWFSMKSLSRMTIVLPWCVFWIILLFRSMLRRRIQNPLKHLRWTVCFIMLRTRFRVNLHSIVAWMLRNPLLETGAISEELAKVDEAPVSSKEFIQATIEWRFTLKHVRDIIKTVKCTVQKSTHNTAQSLRPVWLNCWVFVCELSGCGFESR